MLKPKPMMYEPDLSHLANCTSCSNQAEANEASRRHSLPAHSGAVQLLADDAVLETWADVVHELEAPRKERVRFASYEQSVGGNRKRGRASATLLRAHPHPRRGFGMPGTVLHEGGIFRAWLSQRTQQYLESHLPSCYPAPGVQ